MLGLSTAKLLSYPDGTLRTVPLGELARPVLDTVAGIGVSHLLVFDRGGVTGRPDRVRATEAALTAAETLGLPVLGWALPPDVATALNAEFGTSFTGRRDGDLAQVLTVDRARQWRAIACHHGQSADNPVLRRRLELLGDSEHLRVLRPPVHDDPDPTGGHCRDADS